MKKLTIPVVFSLRKHSGQKATRSYDQVTRIVLQLLETVT